MIACTTLIELEAPTLQISLFLIIIDICTHVYTHTKSLYVTFQGLRF